MDELVLDLGDVVSEVQPALLAALQPADVVAVEGDVVDPVGQAAAHPGLPRPGLDDHAFDAAQVPDGEEPAVPGVVEDVLGPAPLRALPLHDLLELEAHRLGVELVRLLHVLGRDGYVVEHGILSVLRQGVEHAAVTGAAGRGPGTGSSAVSLDTVATSRPA